jgi:hypothetical protein
LPAEPLPDLFRDVLDSHAQRPPAASNAIWSFLSNEERAAVDAFAAGWDAVDPAANAQTRRWEAFIKYRAQATRRHEIRFAEYSTSNAAAFVTRTRLGFMSCWAYRTDDEGIADGSALIPMSDEIGWYVWWTGHAALWDGLHNLWFATRDRAPGIAQVVQDYCRLVDNIDVTVPPPEGARRRLLARTDVDAAAARAFQAETPNLPKNGKHSEDRGHSKDRRA